MDQDGRLFAGAKNHDAGRDGGSTKQQMSKNRPVFWRERACECVWVHAQV